MIISFLRTIKRALVFFWGEACRVLVLSILLFIPEKVDSKRKILFFGVPIISIKYITQGIKPIVSKSTSFVKDIYSIHKISDFDYVSSSFFLFAKQLRKHNIYLIFYDSLDVFFGPVSKLFFRFYRWLKQKKIVVMPYGGDSYVYSQVGHLPLRHVLNVNYPQLGLQERYIKKRYDQVNTIADFRLACLGHLFNLSTWDMLPVHYYPVNISSPAKKNNKYEKFTIVHSPNHRGIKGTEYVMKAISNLLEKGYQIQLHLLENVPNDRVIEELTRSHLLIEQIVGGYALSAMEGMALGLPVISNVNLKENEVFKHYSYLEECPIVSVDLSVSSIENAIIFAMNHYDSLSEKSSNYIKKYHSYKACAVMWNKIFQFLEGGERPINYFHPLLGDYAQEYSQYINSD